MFAGEIQLVYASPEALLPVPKWREMLRQEVYQDNIVCLAVDEAHLVDKWCVLNLCCWALVFIHVMYFTTGAISFVQSLLI